MGQVGSFGVENFAYVDSGVATQVVATPNTGRSVIVFYEGAIEGGYILTEGLDFLDTESSDRLHTEAN